MSEQEKFEILKRLKREADADPDNFSLKADLIKTMMRFKLLPSLNVEISAQLGDHVCRLVFPHSPSIFFISALDRLPPDYSILFLVKIMKAALTKGGEIEMKRSFLFVLRILREEDVQENLDKLKEYALNILTRTDDMGDVYVGERGPLARAYAYLIEAIQNFIKYKYISHSNKNKEELSQSIDAATTYLSEYLNEPKNKLLINFLLTARG